MNLSKDTIYPIMVFLILLFSVYFSKIGFGAEPLSLNQYLGQVSQQNSAIKGAQEASQGAALRSKEGSLLVAPTLFGNLQMMDESKQSPFFRYETIESRGFSLGVSQLTTFGLQAKLSYTYSSTEYLGLSPPFGPRPPFYEGRPAIEVSQSLWRNFFGAETRARVELAEAAALATHYSQSYQVKVAHAEAETIYWRLAAARELVAIQKDILERAQKLYEWNARRERLQLGDKSDIYQAEANLQLRKLQLQSAQDQERTAARAFNRMRHQDSDTVPDTLVPFSTVLSKNSEELVAPSRGNSAREDVKAAEQQSRAAMASAELGVNQNKPMLEAYATYALNSFEGTSSQAFSRSLRNDYPTKILGVRFSAPLNFGLLGDSKRGYEKEKAGAEHTYQQRLFDQENEWKNLNESFSEAKNRLKLARSVEDVQKKKFQNERDRLNRGRTTTYQVLLFEQDYAQAQLSSIQAQNEVLEIIARMKTFGGAQ